MGVGFERRWWSILFLRQEARHSSITASTLRFRISFNPRWNHATSAFIPRDSAATRFHPVGFPHNKKEGKGSGFIKRLYWSTLHSRRSGTDHTALPANYTVYIGYIVSIHQMAHPRLRLRASNCSLILIYLPRKDERLSWPGWLVTQWDSLPARRQSPTPVLTGLDVEQLRWSRPTRYRYTKPPTVWLAIWCSGNAI